MCKKTDKIITNRNFKIMSIDFDKKITLELIGLDGNAVALMSVFSKRAKKENWLKEEIDYVLWQCMQVDYDHLLQTLIKHTKTDEDNPDVIHHNGRTYIAID